MENGEQCPRPNPKLTANVFSRLFFCWMFPIFLHGKNHDLQIKDLYEVLPENLSEPLTNKLENFWKVEYADAREEKRKPNLFRALRKTFQWAFLRYAVYYFFSHLVLKILQPLTMGLIIWHFDQRSNSTRLEAFGYATFFIFITFLDQTLFSHMSFGLRSLGISLRVACASLVHRKVLKVPQYDNQVARGRIVNLVATDVSKLELTFMFPHALWTIPIQAVIITYLIWRNVGSAALIGVCSLFIQTIPLQAFSGKIIAQLRRQIALRTDERLLLTSEIIRAIRVIKMYSWEKPFEKIVFLARRYEVDAIAKTSYLKSFLWSILSFAQRTPLFITLMIYVLQGGSISSYTMFSLVQYFNMLHVMMGSFFLRAVNTLSESIASIRRIQEFLITDEEVCERLIPTVSNKNTMVSITGVTVRLMEKSRNDRLSNIKSPCILQDVNLCIRPGLLYAAVGPVGGGKSSILKLILNEFKPTKGEVQVFGEIAYASQEPWLFKGTIKNNILFDKPYDQKKYEEVTKACALWEDFKQLPGADETNVGENGSNLSGGQCARINLARAVYRDADIYLLDDPLSAVDTRVGKRLFRDCINGVLKNKTRVLVTHQLQYLKEADEIILIDDGRVEYQGDFDNLQKTDDFFQHLNLNDMKSETEKKRSNKNSTLSLNSQSNFEDDQNRSEPEETDKLMAVNNTPEKIKQCIDDINPRARVINARDIYWKYITASGSCVLPFATLFCFTVAQILYGSCDYFIAYWARKQDSDIRLNDTKLDGLEKQSHFDSREGILIFGILILASIFMSIMKMVLYTTSCKRSNESIHHRMIRSLLRATIQFFENNDSGRILNRFSKDMGTVDETLQAIMLETIEFMFIIIGVIVQIIILNSWFLGMIVFLTFLFWKGRKIIIHTSQAMMRLDGQAKSPVVAQVSSSFTGRLTIRSCNAESLVSKIFDTYQDRHTAASSIIQYSAIAYRYWIDIITLIFMALLIYNFLMFNKSPDTGANVGLAITQVLILINILARGMKILSDTETMMISVERLFQYTELEQENLMDDQSSQKPPCSWPTEGEIKFDNLCMKYFQSDSQVLKNLHFTIAGGSKVGIVGRSGAGKSSLITALFRLAEIEGSIYIDNIDINDIGLCYLRDRISILPQDPMLFSVTLRKNLDPVEKLDDASLWSALQDVELNSAFASLDLLLDHNNLSTGQRQLLCLARAILKKSKILILDEATANVDANTDALIQKTIRAKFKNCTVLTIAHRLNTIMDCDKILVMDQGHVVEYDDPNILSNKSNGYFSNLVSRTNTVTHNRNKETLEK